MVAPEVWGVEIDNSEKLEKRFKEESGSVRESRIKSVFFIAFKVLA